MHFEANQTDRFISIFLLNGCFIVDNAIGFLWIFGYDKVGLVSIQ